MADVGRGVRNGGGPRRNGYRLRVPEGESESEGEGSQGSRVSLQAEGEEREGGWILFESLTERLSGVFQRLRGHGVLRPEDVDQAMREVRVALLEADVELSVVKAFTTRLRERSVGEEVLTSLTPAQTVIKIVNEELIRLLGGESTGLRFGEAPSALVVVGLQGSGKTTVLAKLAYLLSKQGRRPLLVAGDLVRPAAAEQLRILAERVGVPILTAEVGETAPSLAMRARDRARQLGRDTVLVDTAGRMQVDEALMEEAREVVAAAGPSEVLLVVDAMTGQESVRVAKGFQAHMSLTGIVLTKLDGDARGGAALSLRETTGLPIKFVGTGERTEALEIFHSDRMASRILGMGDLISLIERTQETVDAEAAHAMERSIQEKGGMDLDDFLASLRQVKKLGPLENLLGMLPGMAGLKAARDLKADDGDLLHVEAIVSSMTKEERRRPEILDGSRKRRIARGSGTQVQDVNRLLRQFEGVQRMMRDVGGMSRRLRRSGLGTGLPGAGLAVGRGTPMPPSLGGGGLPPIPTGILPPGLGPAVPGLPGMGSVQGGRTALTEKGSGGTEGKTKGSGPARRAVKHGKRHRKGR